MKTKAELEQQIVHLSIKINREFPELSKYISEMPERGLGIDDAQSESKNLKEYYNSLLEVLTEYAKTHLPQTEKVSSTFPGYPSYPPSDDIYAKGKEEGSLNPEDISKKKTPNEEEGTSNEKGFKNHMSGNDLDIPGSELDDQQESVGIEDEENNGYSLGGDNHEDLEEDNG
jgi:hypothetical protein